MGKWRYSSTNSDLGTRLRSVSRLYRFTPGETAPGTHCTGSWIGLRTGLDVMDKSLLALPGIEPRLLGRATRSLVAISTEFYPAILRLT
jgi:hypothetical protein